MRVGGASGSGRPVCFGPQRPARPAPCDAVDGGGAWRTASGEHFADTSQTEGAHGFASRFGPVPESHGSVRRGGACSGNRNGDRVDCCAGRSRYGFGRGGAAELFGGCTRTGIGALKRRHLKEVRVCKYPIGSTGHRCGLCPPYRDHRFVADSCSRARDTAAGESKHRHLAVRRRHTRASQRRNLRR